MSLKPSFEKQIYGILAKGRYSRGNPLKEEKIHQLIADAVEQNEPIKLVGFWGVGSKIVHNEADVKTCEFLTMLNNEVKKIYFPGIEFLFIFADSHGLHNGYQLNDIRSYIESMKGLFEKYNYKWVILSNYWNKYQISGQKIKYILDLKPEGWWNNIENRETFEKNALHRNVKSSPQHGAQGYYVMRDLEKEMLEKEFKGFIFNAFSDPKLKNVLPDMPTFYFYARESWSNAPWFVN